MFLIPRPVNGFKPFGMKVSCWCTGLKILAMAMLTTTATVSAFEVQGHRGARGLLPENTLPAFVRALKIGVNTLELDIAMTRDKVVVVSHDSQLNPALTRGPDGQWLSGGTPLIRDLSAAELARYDVGRLNPDSRYARRFQYQDAVDGARIPSLLEVFDLVKQSGNEQVHFNIETKINPNKPELTWPAKELVEAVLKVVHKADMMDRVILQSFDWSTLQFAQTLAPEIPTSYLSVEQNWRDNIKRGHDGASPWTANHDIDDYQGSLPRMIKAAGGSIWSAYHKDVDTQKVAEAHALGLKVIIWTVNDSRRATQLMDMGVDGIISDYPDMIRKLMKERGIPRPATTTIIQ